MTPEEKGDELFNKFFDGCRLTLAGAGTIFHGMAAKLAIICVEEILNDCNTDKMTASSGDLSRYQFWNEVLTYLKSKQ